MRLALIAATACFALAACKGSDSGPANNAQANAAANSPATTTQLTMLAGPVSGDDAKRVMHDRHEGMETIGKSSKVIKRELEGASPDLGVVRASAGKLAELSQKASGWFPAGTGPDVGKTGAKPEIWANGRIKDDFVTKLSAFQKAAGAFNSAAAGNDVNAIKASFGDLGKSCKACHDSYRSEMHH